MESKAKEERKTKKKKEKGDNNKREDHQGQRESIRIRRKTWRARNSAFCQSSDTFLYTAYDGRIGPKLHSPE